MDLGLNGRTAFVAASTGGLGRATATALADEGANVVITGRRGELARSIASELPNAISVAIDLTDPASIDAAVDAGLEAFGAIDVLVLNSGGPPPGRAVDLGPDDLAEAARLLVHPHQQLVNRLVPAMQERGWGRVVAIGSSGVQQPIPNLALSNGLRGAVAGLLKTLAGEVAADGVTVNMVLPGRIATDRVADLDQGKADREQRPVEEVRAASEARIPVGRYGDPAEFAAVATFLCSAAASYVTGSQIRVDGGLVAAL